MKVKNLKISDFFIRPFSDPLVFLSKQYRGKAVGPITKPRQRRTEKMGEVYVEEETRFKR